MTDVLAWLIAVLAISIVTIMTLAVALGRRDERTEENGDWSTWE